MVAPVASSKRVSRRRLTCAAAVVALGLVVTGVSSVCMSSPPDAVPTEWLRSSLTDCYQGNHWQCAAVADDVAEGRAARIFGLARFEQHCARDRAADCFIAGTVVARRGPANFKRALALFDRGCSLDHAPSCYETAKLLQDAHGGPQSWERAYAYWDRSCTVGKGWGCSGAIHRARRALLGVKPTQRTLVIRSMLTWCRASNQSCEVLEQALNADEITLDEMAAALKDALGCFCSRPANTPSCFLGTGTVDPAWQVIQRVCLRLENKGRLDPACPPSSWSPPPPPAASSPKILPPKKVEAQRIRGDRRIWPGPGVGKAMRAKGQSRIEAIVKMCLDRRGKVKDLSFLRRTPYPAYNAKILHEMKTWRYRPFVTDQGLPTPICTGVTFIYVQRAP